MFCFHMGIFVVVFTVFVASVASGEDGAPVTDSGQATEPTSGTAAQVAGDATVSGQAATSDEAPSAIAQGPAPATPATAAPAPAPAPQQPGSPGPYSEEPAVRAEALRLAIYEERRQERERIRQERLKQREISRLSGRRFLVTGGILLGAGYLASTIIGGVMIDLDVEGAGYPFIPIVGNPIYVAQWVHRERNDEYYDDDEPLFMASFMLMLPAIVQTVGTALLITGIVKRARYNKNKRNNVPLVTPTAMRNGGGLTVSMQF